MPTKATRSALQNSRSLRLARICGRATRDCEEISMPFALIPTALGVCFCLVWVFIGGMILRDGQLAAQQDLDSDVGIVRLPTRARRRGAAVARAETGRPVDFLNCCDDSNRSIGQLIERLVKQLEHLRRLLAERFSHLDAESPVCIVRLFVFAQVRVDDHQPGDAERLKIGLGGELFERLDRLFVFVRMQVDSTPGLAWPDCGNRCWRLGNTRPRPAIRRSVSTSFAW